MGWWKENSIDWCRAAVVGSWRRPRRSLVLPFRRQYVSTRFDYFETPSSDLEMKSSLLLLLFLFTFSSSSSSFSTSDEDRGERGDGKHGNVLDYVYVYYYTTGALKITGDVTRRHRLFVFSSSSRTHSTYQTCLELSAVIHHPSAH